MPNLHNLYKSAERKIPQKNSDYMVGHNCEWDPPKDHACQVLFNLVQRFQRRRFKCDLLSKYVLGLTVLFQLSINFH
jgi:hypothetical protein